MLRAIAAVAGLVADLDAGIAAAQPLNTATVRQVRLLKSGAGLGPQTAGGGVRRWSVRCR